MDIAAILAVAAKGIGYINSAISIGETATPAIVNAVQIVNRLITAANGDGEITDEQLTADETALDGLITSFNEPMPPRAA